MEAGLYTGRKLAGLLERWAYDGLLPPEAPAEMVLRLIDAGQLKGGLGEPDTPAGPPKQWSPECLADVVHERTVGLVKPAPAEPILDAVALEALVKRWADRGLLPPEVRHLNEKRLSYLVRNKALVELAGILQPLAWEEELALLPDEGLQDLESEWHAAGFLKDDEHLDRARLATYMRDETLDCRRRREAWRTFRARRVVEFAGLFERWRNSLIPYSLLLELAGRRRDAGLKVRLDPDPDHNRLNPEFLEPAQIADLVKVWSDERRQEFKAAREHAPPLSPQQNEALVLQAIVLEALTREECSRDLVGLALSGGGIRSASFNLGLLQALEPTILRRVDYLSTVSGGGYIGSFLSSLVLRGDVHFDRDRFPTRELPIRPEDNGRQPERVVKLVRSGTYLNRFGLHASRYLVGLFLNNLVIFSGLLGVCVTLALVWRLLDTSPVCDWLAARSHGWIMEWNRPFLPAAVVLLAWLAVYAAGLMLRGKSAQPALATGLLYAAGLCFLVGVAVWLATPHINLLLPTIGKGEGQPPALALGNYPLYVLLVLAAIGLAPFLRPQRFLESGTGTHGAWWERVVFRVLTTALLVGIPFFLVYLFARHGIAADLDPSYDAVGADRSIGRQRTDLHPSDIYYPRWAGFWERLRSEHALDPHSFGGEVWGRLPVEHRTQAEKTLYDLKLRHAIQDVPTPLDAKVRETKKELAGALNARVIQSADFTRAVLGGRRGAELVAYLRKQAGHRSEGDRLTRLLDKYEQGRLFDAPESETYNEARDLNRLLLEAYYPGVVWDRTIIRRPVVIERDQRFRGWLVLLAFGMCVASASVVSLNATSLHGIYRGQLGHVYIDPPGEVTPDIPIHQLDTTSKGAPYHLISGALNKGSVRDENPRPTVNFIFSQRYCGSVLTGFVPSETYMDGKLDLATAMAISGAAFSPARVHNRLVAFLMVVLNLRLGQWLPSPRHPQGPGRLPMLRLVLSLLFDRGVARRRYWFISDGGHNENLGLGPLLRRECKLIVVSDAGYDPDFGFDDFVQLYRHARIQGIRFKTLDAQGFISLDPLVPDKDKKISRHRYLIARIEYPGPGNKWGLLVYLKPSFGGDEEIDLKRYRAVDSAFPHDSTVNQWFDEDQVESYRELGSWIGGRLLEKLFSGPDSAAWVPDELGQRWRGVLEEVPQAALAGGR
jgi:hypothetical protein